MSLTAEEAMAITDSDPEAFPCPTCGARMAVIDIVHIFHRKPLCVDFERRDHTYYDEILALARARKEEINRGAAS